ncbi:regulator of chromosome condensation-like [Ptychodera flava]|uniref:regulator of chromosome condensation-like n=1 Tax=Ptychodera flava TaxID=63121 RepID=UPI003969F447
MRKTYKYGDRHTLCHKSSRVQGAGDNVVVPLILSDTLDHIKMPPREKKSKRSSVEANKDEQPNKKIKVTVSHPSHCTTPGVVLALGQGDVGQLGLGEDIMERKRPALVPLPEEAAGKVVQVVAGGMHTVCLTKAGKIYTFGCNDEGALGRDTSEDGSEYSPGVVPLSSRVVQVSGGDSHTAALTEEGKVFAWGTFRDGSGVIGLTMAGNHSTPIEVLPNQTVVQIASGADHLCMLTSEGDIFSMGTAEQGQLGRVAECFSIRGGRRTLKELLEPSVVHCRRVKGKGKAIFDHVWCTAYCTFARVSGVGLFAWGLNNYHHLGLQKTKTWFVPQPLQSCKDMTVTSISGGQHHTVLQDDQGNVYSIGRTDYGRLGLGENPEESHIPQKVSSLTDKVTNVGCGSSVSAVVTEKGEIYTWGMGSSLQLGTGEEDDEYSPVLVKGKQLESRKGVMVSVGGQHTVILAADES